MPPEVITHLNIILACIPPVLRDIGGAKHGVHSPRNIRLQSGIDFERRLCSLELGEGVLVGEGDDKDLPELKWNGVPSESIDSSELLGAKTLPGGKGSDCSEMVTIHVLKC
jgi:hypothetical protein